MSSPQQGSGLGGGGVLGANRFLGGDNESTWIAVFCLFIIWLIGLFISPIAEKAVRGDLGTTTGKDPPQSIRNFTRSARDAFLILFATTVANLAGHGIDSTVMAITWTSFAVLIVWIIIQSTSPTTGGFLWWVSMLFFFPVLCLQIANFALAFRNAPSTK